MNIYGDRLKFLRLENGLTKAELTKFLKVKNGSINSIETGDIMPNQKIAAKLAAYFNTDVDYWLDLDLEVKKLKFYDVAEEISDLINDFKEANLLNDSKDIYENEHFKKSLLNITENFYIWKKLKEQD